MAQFYPDGMCDINLNRARENSSLVTPPQENFDEAGMRGSMQEILSDNLGQYVVCEFLVGTQAMTRKEGLLYSVGRAYVTLYDEAAQTFVVCDIFSIKFVTFYMPGQRPGRSGGQTVPLSGLSGSDSGSYGMGSGSATRGPAPGATRTISGR